MNYALYDGNKLNLLYKKYTIYVFCHNYHNHHQYVHNYTKPLLAIIACIHTRAGGGGGAQNMCIIIIQNHC